MTETFQIFYANVITIVTITTVMAFVTIHVVGAVGPGLQKTDAPRILGPFALYLGLWYALATYFGRSGAMGQELFPGGPPTLGLFFIGAAVLSFVLSRQLPKWRIVTDRIGQEYLMGFQSIRVLGVIFLVGGALGQIPWIFAIPAGLGDIWAGYMGYRAMKAVARNDPAARRKIREANLVGIADFAIALTTGLITSETIYQLTAFDAPNIVGQYPLVLIPAVMVPLFLTAHFLSISKLRDGRIPAEEPIA